MQCWRCGREVEPTFHTKEGTPPYRVGYYRLLTGKLVHVAIQNPRDESEILEYYKLIEPQWIATCSECMAYAEAREQVNKMLSDVPEGDSEPGSAA